MKIAIKGRRIVVLLLVVFGILFLGNLTAVYCQVALEAESAFGIVPIFHFDRESNLPTLFSGAMLAFAGILAFLIGRQHRGSGVGSHRGWYLVGGVLVFLAIDECAQLHDNLQFILMPRIETSGLLYWPWVIPYAGLALVVVALLFRFFLRLPRVTQGLFAIAAAAYLTGALGMEMIAARHSEQHGSEGWTYHAFVIVEESLEMMAVILLIGGLFHYAGRFADGLRLTLVAGFDGADEGGRAVSHHGPGITPGIASTDSEVEVVASSKAMGDEDQELA